MPIIKKRHIPVDNLTCSGCEKDLKSSLADLDGVDVIYVDRDHGKVDIEYDLLKTNLKVIETRLRDSGFSIHENLLNRIRNTFINFTEENERDTMTAPQMPCCSHPNRIFDELERRKMH